MISLKDISITKKVKKVLLSKDIRLSEINYRKLFPILRKYFDIDIKLHSNKDWNVFKQTPNYSKVMNDMNELFGLGYGCKFISLCLSIKYRIFISFLMIHKRLNRDRIKMIINNRIFCDSDISIKGRIIHSICAKSFYLAFKCAKIRDFSKRKSIGVKVFFDKRNNRTFLERDDRSAKKIFLHSKNELFISLYPLPDKIKEALTVTDNKTYKTIPIEINFNSNNFGFLRHELIDDIDARSLFPYLEKFHFKLEKRRVTNASRSLGDLVVYKNNQKIVIEITKTKPSSKKSHTTNIVKRDRLIGKITRICLSKNLTNNNILIFILHDDLKGSIVNEDFNNVIRHFDPLVLFTDFNKGWEKIIAEKINDLIESK